MFTYRFSRLAVAWLALWLSITITVPAAAQSVNYTTLYWFTGGFDAADPWAGLVQGTDGNFYGTSVYGGSGFGTVFKITPTGTETVLHIFANNSSDGGYPYGGLIQATDGNLYGTTNSGGAQNFGTVFKITPGGTETVLYSFTGGADGLQPRGRLIQATDGNFYGTTLGGASNSGAVFKITPTGSETTLHSFAGGTSDGANPQAGLIQASDGNLYGTTSGGGTDSRGTVFAITTGGTYDVLYSFRNNGSDGANPFAALIQASDGNFYGTTLNGGAHAMGTVFAITSGGGENIVHTFGGSDGEYPYSGLIQGSDGNFYGTTEGGGANGVGTVFQITLTGTETVLHSFGSGSDGRIPYSGLIQAADGKFYGTTYYSTYNGTPSDGTVYAFSISATAPTINSLSPSSTPACGPAFTLTVNGSGFVSGAVVNWNGTALATTFVSGTHLTASVPVSDIAAPGSASVTVQESGTASNALTFTITNPLPVLKSLSPTSADMNGPAFTLTVKGSCFLSSSVIYWGNTPLSTTFVSAGELKGAVPASFLTQQVAVPITVVTPSPGGGTSKAIYIFVVVTTVKLTGASLVRNSDGSYTATVSLKNVGYNPANNTQITKSTLGGVATATPLSLVMGDIAAGTTATATLSFPASAGTSGSVVKLTVNGTFSRGKFAGSLKVKLP